MSPDALLGRDYTFRQSDGYTVILARVTVVGFCPATGVRLAGAGFSPAWVDHATWRRLLMAGVLRDA